MLRPIGFMHKAAAGGGGGGLTGTYIDRTTQFTASTAGGAGTFDASAIADGDQLYITIAGKGLWTEDVIACELDGAACTLVGRTSNDEGRSKAFIFKVTANATTAGNASASFDVTNGNFRDSYADVFKVVGTITTETFLGDPPDGSTGLTLDGVSRTLDINTGAGGVIIAAAMVEDDGTLPTITWSGITEVAESALTGFYANQVAGAALAATPTAETPRAVSVAFTNWGQSAAAIVALS